MTTEQRAALAAWDSAVKTNRMYAAGHSSQYAWNANEEASRTWILACDYTGFYEARSPRAVAHGR